MSPTLTTRQREVLGYIRDYHAANQYYPVLREVAEHFKLAIGTVQAHVDCLKSKGALDWEKGKSRTLRVSEPMKVQGRQKFYERGRKAAPAELIEYPVLGTVSAGPGLLAEENVEDTFTLSANFFHQGDGAVFGLKVKGDSMIGAGILEGDVVMVRKQETADEGSIVVALAEGEASVKYFQTKSTGTYLISANPEYPPRKMDESFSIIGKVVGTMRRY